MTPTNGEKKRGWDAYRARRLVRVPVTFGVNPRVVLFDPDWNPGGITFKGTSRTCAPWSRSSSSSSNTRSST